jgi:hypothetical protein
MSWIKGLIHRNHQRTIRRKNEREAPWEVTLTPRYIILPHPERYRPIKLWDKWGKMQANLLSSFNQQWEETHIYFWIQTYVPESISNILVPGKFETMTSVNKDEKIFLFPDCQDQNVWTTILSMMALGGLSRCIFVLKNKPRNWGDIVAHLRQIIQKLEAGRSLSEFQSELTMCHCLCGSGDEDLVIYKIDLEEDIVLSVIENIAKQEDLE